MNKIGDSISVHQPHFLPWYPYMLRILSGESYTAFTQENYKPRYFHNRTGFIQRDGTPFQASIPVNGSQNTCFADTTIDREHGAHVSRKVLNTLKNTYGYTPYFDDIFEKIERVLSLEGGESLEDVNLGGIQVLANIIGIPMPEVHRQTRKQEESANRTQNLIDKIQESGKSTYLSGWGGGINPQVFDLEKFKEHGIEIKYPDPEALSKYSDTNGVSILHHLFHDGPEQVRAQMEQDQNAFVSLKI